MNRIPLKKMATLTKILAMLSLLVIDVNASWASEQNSAEAKAEDPISSKGLLEDVFAFSEQPVAYDWQKSSIEIELGVGNTDESNNFETEVYHLGAGIPVADNKIRFGMRRVIVMGTTSSDLLARTPFTQQATQTRYEVYGLFDYSLMQGRSISRISGMIPDLEQVLFLPVGLHYSHPNQSWLPKKSDEPEALPGQKAVNSSLVLELGLRWQVYLPNHFGIYLDWARHFRIPPSKELPGWTYVSGGVVWNFAL